MRCLLGVERDYDNAVVKRMPDHYLHLNLLLHGNNSADPRFPESKTLTIEPMFSDLGRLFTPYKKTFCFCKYRICCPKWCIVLYQKLSPELCCRPCCRDR
ncbi:hypothetical protein SK128_004258, partial [Halocaridina rubra]